MWLYMQGYTYYSRHKLRIILERVFTNRGEGSGLLHDKQRRFPLEGAIQSAVAIGVREPKNIFYKLS